MSDNVHYDALQRHSQGANVDPVDPRATSGGKTYDDLQVGDRHLSEAREVLDADIAAFAALTGDENPIHLDDAAARRSPFRGRIAHGLLVQSLASGLAWRSGLFRGTIVALAEIQMRFQAPVRPGDTIRLELTVLEREVNPGPRRGSVRWRTVVLNQRDETVIDGEWRTLLERARNRSGEEPST